MFNRLPRLPAVVLAILFAAASTAAAQTALPTRAPVLPDAPGTKWIVDPVHSQVEFGIRHLVGRVRGSFTRWYGVIATQDSDWTNGTVKVQVQTASINTGNAYRDADLRSRRFLDAAGFPAMTFESTDITATDSTVVIGGNLTLKGHARYVVLKGQFRGIAKDREGKERIAFDASTVLDRRDYGIDYNELVEGANLIGDDVEITIALEAVKAPEGGRP
jgi:polyisoprenoid-binding protein YceI